jgi:hypothetical protein
MPSSSASYALRCSSRSGSAAVTIVEQHAKQPALPRTFRRESARLDERGVARLGRHLQPRGAQRVEFLHGRHVAAPLT